MGRCAERIQKIPQHSSDGRGPRRDHQAGGRGHGRAGDCGRDGTRDGGSRGDGGGAGCCCGCGDGREQRCGSSGAEDADNGEPAESCGRATESCRASSANPARTGGAGAGGGKRRAGGGGASRPNAGIPSTGVFSRREQRSDAQPHDGLVLGGVLHRLPRRPDQGLATAAHNLKKEPII